ncbi:MAG: peptidoglycan/LPS O-acetylase OafA/YrhL [Limisphaerales bacterium]|jgi:peptidoglycan/LPS O-acetylase OafA/YrhL
METPPAIPNPRRHDLDALRAVAMLLGIVLHCALSFIPGFWPVNDSQTNETFGIVVAAIHGFRMPLFFILSGFFTAMLWRKRGLRQLLAQRFKRVFLPLVLCLFTIIPLVWVVTIAAKTTGGGGESSGVRPVASEGADIWTAARVGDLGAISKMIAGEADLDQRDPILGSTPISGAALYGQTEVTKALIAGGADVNARSKDGNTALHSAAFLGYSEIVAALLAADADFGTKNNRGETPLDSMAVAWGATEWVAGLLKLKIEKKAVMAGRAKCGELFKAYGASLAEISPPKADQNERRNPGALVMALFVFPVFHHLWFLWFLCWLVLGFSVCALVADKLGWKSSPPWLTASPLRYLWIIPLTMIPQWAMGLLMPNFGPDTSLGLLPMPQVLFYYAIFFGFGALYFDAKDEQGRLGRFWWLTMPFALLIVFPLGLELTVGRLGFAEKLTFINEENKRPVAVFLQVLYAWMMSAAFIGLFRQLLQRENRTLRYLSDSSYWLYIAHIPLVIGLQAAVRNWPLPALVKSVMICAATVGILLFLYQTMVRYTWLGRLLNGPRTRPVKVGVSD